MIQMHDSDIGFAPLMICDYCGERITEAHKAAAITSQANPHSNANKRVIHVHKGGCFDAVEAREGGMVPWQEMSQHLRHLLNNVDITLNDLQEEARTERQAGLTTE